MYDDSLKPVYAFVERAYVRMQAGDIILRCLEEGTGTPMQHMVEELVLAGPDSLETLREIQEELDARRQQIKDDLHQMFADLDSRMNVFGISLSGKLTPLALAHAAPEAFDMLLVQAQRRSQPADIEKLSMLYEAHKMLASLAVHIDLLEELDSHLQDWLWGLVYQKARIETDAGLASKNKWPL